MSNDATSVSPSFLDHYPFMRRLGRIINSGEARAVCLTGNIQDLFLYEGEGGGGQYLPLVPFLEQAWTGVAGPVVVYELNGPIRFARDADRELLKNAWTRWKTGLDANDLAIQRVFRPSRMRATADALIKDFDQTLNDVVGKPTMALEVLRQLCLCARTVIDGARLVPGQMIIVIEGADLILPESEVARLSEGDRHRMYICYDWFSDPAFLDGNTAVVLVAESRSQVNHRIARLPQMMEVAIPSPDEPARTRFISRFNDRQPEGAKVAFWSSQDDVARYTAGLSLQALRQLLLSALHQKKKRPDYMLSLRDVTEQVATFIKGQLGDDVVEFKQPTHTFDDIIGFRDAKAFIETDVLKGLRLTTKDALSSIIICGAIGVGKTFVWEAVASILGVPILELKNLRSKWFGETDVVFERLRRVLEALSKVLIYVNEADTAFGGVGADTHETERRLTGKLQAMMSDSRLRGRVHWLLDTARVHLLSADMRRPGRGGDLIFSMFDPEGEDRADFIRWTVESVLDEPVDQATFESVDKATRGYYAGAFSSLRAELRRKAEGGKLTVAQMLTIVRDITPADIGLERRYQTLQALRNCTRKSLRPKEFQTLEDEAWDGQVEKWLLEIRKLEMAGIR